MTKSYTTQALADALDGQLVGDGAVVITRLAHPADLRGAGDLALAMDDKLLPLLTKGVVRAAIVGPKAKLESGLVGSCITVQRPRLAMAKLTQLFAEPVAVAAGIHPSAVIEAGAKIGADSA